MQDKKQKLWTVVAVAAAVLTIAVLFQVNDSLSADSLHDMLAGADKFWLASAVVCMMGYIVFEGEAVICILRHLGYKRTHRQGFLYGAADVYFSAITPSASGGQPASAFFMIADGVPGGVVTVALLINLVLYTLALVTIGTVVFVTSPDLFFHFELPGKILIIFGSCVLLALAVLFYLLLRKSTWLEAIAAKLIRFLTRIHVIRKPEKVWQKLETYVGEFRDCARMAHGQTGMILKAYLLNVLQRASQISVSAMMYLATGADRKLFRTVWGTQVFVNIGAGCVPVPGAMGVSDYLMVDGFRDLFSRDYAFHLELLSRGISFYSCVLVSACTVAAGYLHRRRK